jgi:TonB family protein
MALPPATDWLSRTGPGLPLALGGSLLLHLGILFGVPVPVSASFHTVQSLSVHLASAVPAVTPSLVHPAPAIPQPQPGGKLLPLQHPARKHTPLIPVHTMPLRAMSASNAAPRATTVPAAKNPAISASIYYEDTQLDVPPHLLGEVQQVYPARARAADIEGSVTLSLLIDAHGKVDHINVISAQPRGYFEQAALDMLRSQRFTPALIHNRPVKSRWHTVVRYRLQS